MKFNTISPEREKELLALEKPEYLCPKCSTETVIRTIGKGLGKGMIVRACPKCKIRIVTRV